MTSSRKTDDLEQHAIAGSHYGFSATRIDDLGAAEYTLVTIAADKSGSVAPFENDIERCIAEVVAACHRSPRADNLMLRVISFDSQLHELHGFKPLSACQTDAYQGAIHGGGSTALHDALYNAVEAATRYGRALADADFDVNAIVFVITDGCDNASQARLDDVTAAVAAAAQSEAVESLATVLVGVNIADPGVGRALDAMKRQAKLDRYVEIGRADAHALAKLADFVSRSIAAQSQALGSGSASIPLSF